jgi:hypothetical protein
VDKPEVAQVRDVDEAIIRQRGPAAIVRLGETGVNGAARLLALPPSHLEQSHRLIEPPERRLTSVGE